MSTTADKHGLYRDLGYSSHDIISTMFKVTKIHPSLSEHAKLEFIKVKLRHTNGVLLPLPMPLSASTGTESSSLHRELTALLRKSASHTCASSKVCRRFCSYPAVWRSSAKSTWIHVVSLFDRPTLISNHASIIYRTIGARDGFEIFYPT